MSSEVTRRRLIGSAIAVVAGASGMAVAGKLARHYELIPPDHGGLFGLGESLTYASQRLLTNHSLAREFSRSQISPKPFANGQPPQDEKFKRLQAGGFSDWRLTVNGLCEKPATFSVAEVQSHAPHTQITHLACEEGWSYIAEWTGTRLSDILQAVKALPQARYVVYSSIERDWWDSIDMADALHPQTLVAYGMNGADLPIGHGGPLRLRVPRQLGYKNVKYITRLTLTDDLKKFGKGLGSSAPEGGYAWYAGI